MKSKKQKSGITLIALIITIIVLLILAGVSISLALGENGVVTKAENAAKTSEEVQIQEAFWTAYMNAISEGYDLLGNEKFINKIKEELEKTYGTGNVEIEKEDNGYRVTVDGESYLISDISSIIDNGSTIASSGNVEYTVQFLDYDGETIFWSTIVKEGSSVTYGGETPERLNDGTYDYSFDGYWVTSPGGTEVADLSNVRSNTRVYASYTASTRGDESSETVNTFTVDIYNEFSGDVKYTIEVEENMTWGEWVESKYNTIGAYFGSPDGVSGTYLWTSDSNSRYEYWSKHEGYLWSDCDIGMVIGLACDWLSYNAVVENSLGYLFSSVIHKHESMIVTETETEIVDNSAETVETVETVGLKGDVTDKVVDEGVYEVVDVK